MRATDDERYPRRLRASLPQQPVHRPLGTALFETDRESRDHGIAPGQAAHQRARADPWRADRFSRRKRHGLLVRPNDGVDQLVRDDFARVRLRGLRRDLAMARWRW